MRNYIFILFSILFFFTQCAKKPINNKSPLPKVKMGYLTSNFNTPTFLYGQVKEYTQVSYGAKMVDGIVIKGEQLKNSRIMSNVSTRNATFYYSDRGIMEKVVFYDDDGNPSTVAHCVYNEGKLNEVLFKMGNLQVQNYKMIYDENNIKEILIYLNNDALRGKYVYEYDNNGFIIKETYFNENGDEQFRNLFERYEDGRWKFSSYFYRNRLIRKVENIYDENKQVKAMNYLLLNGEYSNTTGKKVYEYDENGNWTKLIRYRGDVPFNITERTFKYYEK